MIYCQTVNKEIIAVHPMNNTNDTQFVELIKYGDVTMFAVYLHDGYEEWVWEFDMENPSDYERIKMNIFAAIHECDTMVELAETLNEIFVEGFDEILIMDEDDECDGCDGCYKMTH